MTRKASETIGQEKYVIIWKSRGAMRTSPIVGIGKVGGHEDEENQDTQGARKIREATGLGNQYTNRYRKINENRGLGK